MTAQNAIHELKQVRQYCSARAIPAIDYAIQVLQGLAEREKRVEEDVYKRQDQDAVLVLHLAAHLEAGLIKQIQTGAGNLI